MVLRINNSSQVNPSGQKPSSSAEKAGMEFSQTLGAAQKLQQKDLQEFLNRLDTQGRKLAGSLSLQDLAEFQSLVKSFLRSTFGQSRNLQEESFWDFRGQPKVLARVTRIDKALEEIGQQVLNEQAKPLEVLKKIDEIRGLILDLFA